MQKGKKIEIKVAGLNLDATLYNTEVSGKIFESLPITGQVNTWGDEIYSPIPLDLPSHEPKELVEFGNIGYWPPGKA